MEGLSSCVGKLVANRDVQVSITNELSTYRSINELFELQTAIKQKSKKSPGE